MPYGQQDHSQEGGLLERQFKLAIGSLKLKRGLFLPKNASAETIALEDPQWTYAIYSAALLYGLHKIQFDRDISLYKKNEERVGGWSALSGSLYEKELYYKLTFINHPVVENKEICMAAIVGRIIPPMAFRWFADNKVLFSDWCDVIFHKPNVHNSIMELITSSAKKQNIELMDQTHYQPSQKNSPENIFNVMKTWIISKTSSNSDEIFRIPSGLFISEKLLENFLVENGYEKQIFINSLVIEEKLILFNDSIYHSLTPKNFEDRRSLRGIIFNINLFNVEMQNFTVNLSFLENISI